MLTTPTGEYRAADLRVTPNRLPRSTLLRRLTYVMLLRVVLFTLLLGGTVGLHFVWGRPEELAGPYVMVLFVFITAVYLLNIVYALRLKSVKDLRSMAGFQIIVDLLLSAVLVHFTGSAESGFVLFFFLGPITAALTLGRPAAWTTAVAGAALLVLVVLLGYLQVLPVLSGQRYLPWKLTPAEVSRSLLINSGAMFFVAWLAGNLAEQLRTAASRVEEQQAYIDDLAALHSDVIRCLSSGLITVDAAGRILTVNRAAAEMLNVREASVAGQSLAALSPQLARLAACGNVRRAEITLDSNNRDRLLGLSISSLTNRQNQPIGLIVNFQDLTNLREMERAMRRSEHLAGLGRVAAGVAHEIRNPLASISGSLELLKRGEAAALTSDDSRRLMQIALREIERLDRLINQLLQYARPQAPQLETLDLAVELRAMVANMSTLMSADDAPALDLVVDHPSQAWIAADRDQLGGVLWNLVRNAWQAGGRERVTVRLSQREGEVTIAVEDHGKGIEPQDLDHIFEPFYTTRAKGSGLGLAIVHRTVQNHNGTISVQSVPGHGTTFTLTFPAVEQMALVN